MWQDEKIFFHQTEVLKTGLKLEVGCKVKFNVGQDPWQKDKLKAYKVKVVAPASNEREWANFMQSKKKSVVKAWRRRAQATEATSTPDPLQETESVSNELEGPMSEDATSWAKGPATGARAKCQLTAKIRTSAHGKSSALQRELPQARPTHRCTTHTQRVHRDGLFLRFALLEFPQKRIP